MATIRRSRPDDSDRVIEIWSAAVDATHDFLTAVDRVSIGEEVSGFLPTVPLWLAVDADDYPLAFMFIHDGQMEALFVDPGYRGSGIGAALVRHGLKSNPSMTTDVNEQNEQAIGFYERMGFVRTGRLELDGQGRPYPLIHLVFQG